MEGIHLNLNEVGGHYLPYLTDDETETQRMVQPAGGHTMAGGC